MRNIIFILKIASLMTRCRDIMYHHQSYPFSVDQQAIKMRHVSNRDMPVIKAAVTGVWTPASCHARLLSYKNRLGVQTPLFCFMPGRNSPGFLRGKNHGRITRIWVFSLQSLRKLVIIYQLTKRCTKIQMSQAVKAFLLC